jgi:hypothetical protein
MRATSFPGLGPQQGLVVWARLCVKEGHVLNCLFWAGFLMNSEGNVFPFCFLLYDIISV